MINVSVSKLVNQVDKSNFTLYTEWEDTSFKIIVLRPCTLPLSGEMHIESANYFLNHLDESFETYLEKTKQAFSGKDIDIQFFLQDESDGMTFTWKQQNILTRGEIAMHSLSNILILSDTLKQSLELYQQYQERALTLEKENEYLKKSNTELVVDLEEIINKKNTMEKDLNMKFLLLLNTKKKKIRELQEALNNTKKTTTKSAYNETTDDESDGSDIKSKKMHDTKPSKLKKQKMDYKNDQEVIPKSSKQNFKRHMNFSSSEDTSPEPSTSKVKLMLQNTNMYDTVKSKRVLNNSEEERNSSEEDMFS
ncbi:PREDICTED: DNA repair protein XRCC4-like isoform X1 [Acromyrmex echinatior]|uniref:DNA repair protein XRCC4 n=2 Tax=Acromyrmex echinatior TaxID=103372 RepID=F4W6E1_ACREC|nr:PREDICTED: DNA repair protein XRCC4-like isoform X1 [Acromyrmex echinatior]EGI70276.1 DNA repair protein XRCC4 [Acromyrmex echinatior]